MTSRTISYQEGLGNSPTEGEKLQLLTRFEQTERVQPGPFASQLNVLRHGDHFCSFYDRPQEQLSVVVPWIKEGLRRGEACLYVADDLNVPAITKALSAAGVDVAAEQRRGALTFTGKWGWRNRGRFDVDAMAKGVLRLSSRLLSRGFEGLWIAVDMTWALDPDIPCEQLAEWESHWNILLRNLPVVLLCQYNRSRLGAETIQHELKTHPMVVLGHQVYPNFFYEPPSNYLDGGTGGRVEWMLDQIRLASVMEAERRRRVRAEIMLKEIHHRVKNSLQIAASLLALQADSVRDRESAEALLESEERIRTMAQVHAALYPVDGETFIDFGRHLRDMLTRLADANSAAAKGIAIEVGTEPVLLKVDEAVPCALIANELAVQALKQTAPRGGRVIVEFRPEGTAEAVIAVQYERPGAGEQPSSSLSMRLVQALAQQIGGALTTWHADGTTFTTVTFPLGRE